jgi:hypothetical protein
MGVDSLVPAGRIWHEFQHVVVDAGARGWNTQRVKRMMVRFWSISTAA